MESIMQLLLGREAQAGEADLADGARRAGQWCASTPGSVFTPVSRLTAYVHGMS